MLLVLYPGAASALLLSPESTLSAGLAGLFCYGAAAAVRAPGAGGAVLSGLFAAAGTVYLHGGFLQKEAAPGPAGWTAVFITLSLLGALAAAVLRQQPGEKEALPSAPVFTAFLAALFLLGTGRLLALPSGSAAGVYAGAGAAVLLLGGAAPLLLALLRLLFSSAAKRTLIRAAVPSAAWTAAALLAPPVLLSLLPPLLTGAYGIHPLLSGWCSLTLLLILHLRRRPGAPAADRQAAMTPSGGTLEEALQAYDSAGFFREEAGGLSVLKPLLRQIAGLLGGGAAVVLRYADDAEHRADAPVESMEEGMDPEEARQAAEEERAGYLRQVILMDEPVTGYLILKGPVKEQTLGREEGERLALLLSSLRFAMENVILARGLSLRLHELAARMPHELKFGWLRRALIDGQERERLRFASDLHDTTAQDLIYVRSRLLPLLERLPADSEEFRLAAGAAGHLELMNENLRQTLFELNPLQLQHLGLTGALQKLAGLERGMQEAEIEFHAVEAVRLEQLPPETKRQLFRLVQELLNNARKHADASRITIELSAAEQGKVHLHYTDDGAGFDPDAAAERAGRGGISSPGLGLLQMRSRVLVLEGTFELVSSPGRGVQVTIQIPVKEVHAV
ncbi:sensor histidine kinase [Paenibacillus sp. S-38]|uniref:sensor histidine kinase n=1 Tax=Paenibacillus sp. S-38 TaxID=3416710 RepID=UPI003CF527F7